MPTSNALKCYSKLPPTEQLFCQACALLFFKSLYLADYPPYLRALNIFLEGGKAITQADVRLLIDRCQALNIFSEGRGVHPDIRHSLVVEALSNRSLRERIMQVYELLPGGQFLIKNKGRSNTNINLDTCSLLCLKIYLSADFDNQAVDQLVKNHEFSQVTKYFCQIDMEWIKTVPMKIQLAIFERKLQLLWMSNSVTPDLQEAMEIYFPLASNPNYPEAANLLVRHCLCTADLRQLSESILAILNVEDDQDLANLASVRFLQGDFAAAKLLFEKSVKLAKVRLKTTKYYPTLIQGCYYGFLLLMQNDPKSLMTLAQGADYVAHNKETIFRPIFSQLGELVVYLHNGTKTSSSQKKDDNLMVQAFSLLITYWMDRSVIEKELKIHQKSFEAAKRYFPGIARIFAEVLSKVSSHPAPYLDYLKETHSLYPIAFLQMVTTKEPWDNSLDLLERLSELKDNDKSLAVNRLLWKIDPHYPSVAGVYEQKINAKGEWTKGRPISLERLKAGGIDFHYITEQDARAISAIECHTVSTYGYYTKDQYEFNHSKALAALVGHPNLINASSEIPIELIKGDVVMLVKKQADQFCVSLSPPCQTESVILSMDKNGCYQVIEIGAELVNLQKIIGNDNALLVPKSTKERLKTILKKLGERFLVQSDLQYENIRKEGDSTLYAKVVPQQPGLKLTLCVYPFGAEGPHFSPGKGLTTPQAMIKGKPKKVQRNLALERQQADQLIQAIEQLQAQNEGYDEWFFEETEEILDLLEALHNYPQPLPLIWPEDKKISITPTLGPQALSLKIKADQDWFSLEGVLQVNQDQVLELKQLLELIDASPSRFIALSDTQFLALTDQFKRQLREIKALAEKQKGSYYLHPLSSIAIHEFAEQVGNFEADARWHQIKERMQNAQKHSPVLPMTFGAELRPYQLEGFQWLSRMAYWGTGACLADDMGLGKTIQALALILEHAEKGPTLVVAPTSVCHNWVNECSRFAPSLKVVLHAKERNPEVLKELGPGQLLVTSYGLLHQEIEQLSAIHWQTIILDEAQVIKNAHTKRSQAAHQLHGHIKIILTGTPIENRLSELWNLFRFINPGLFGSYESFSKRFVEPIEQHKDVAARQVLKKTILPFMLRRLKHQVLTDLPPRIEQTVLVPFESEELAFYEALRQNALEKLMQISSHEKKRIHILAEITRLRRACCHPTLVAPEVSIPSSKLKAAEEIIEELRENRHRALIFSQFVGHLDKVKILLEEKKISYQYLDGATSIDERQKRVAAFQNGQGEFFLISLKAGGTGLNLTAADYVIHLDPWWNPAVEDQASDRAHRLGQTRPVTIYRLIMEGSIEEKMIGLHQQKRGLADDLLSGTDLSGKLSDEELLALL